MADQDTATSQNHLVVREGDNELKVRYMGADVIFR